MRRALALFALLAAGVAGAFPAVEGLVGRLLPGHKDQIVLRDLPAPKAGEAERFAYWSEGGKLVVEANTPVAQAAGLGWYLRHTAKAAPFWEGWDETFLPETLPEAPRVERATPHARRVYFNYCTLSYSAAHWDWARWEREIDLMALHGVNTPLQPIGLEAVWYNTLRRPEVGFSEAEAREFLVGPAFYAWQWMTNIERFGGPVGQAFIEDRVTLGRRIFERERAFGMTPIQQGFTGFVPLRLREKFPEAAIKQQPPWCGSFEGSAQLDPLDPLFPKLAAIFYAEQKALFGADGLYAADPFHESAPPRPGNEYLAAVGKAIYEAAVAADPKATLCMQSWSIRKPILHAIPKEHCLVLDIGGKWRGQKAFDGYPFVIGTIHNFGGRTRMFGNLRGLAKNTFAGVRKQAPNCVGMGLFPEAIHNNPVYFALVFDEMWRDGPVDLDAWLDDWVRARYGADSPKARHAWALLLDTVYRPGTRGMSTLIAARPALDVRRSDPNWAFAAPYDATRVLAAWRALLAAGDEGCRGAAYAFDLADVGRQVLGDAFLALHGELGDAYLAGDAEALRAKADAFAAMARDLDALCASTPLLSFEAWLNGARALPGTPEEKARYASGAACQVTQWGHTVNRPRIYDYAWKEWSGLIRDYYLPRWQRFHAALREALAEGREWVPESKARPQDYGRPALRATPFLDALADWEDAFIADPPDYPAFVPRDARAESARILAAHGARLEALLGGEGPMKRLEAFRKNLARREAAQSGTVVKAWTPKDCSRREWRTWEIDVTKAFDANGEYAVTFAYTHGGARLDIAEVTLLQNGAPVSTDAHAGTTGDVNRGNVYTLRFDDPILGATLTLRAKVRTHGTDRSYGEIRVRRE